MFHIVFDSRGAELLNAAMDLDEALDGEIILMQDDYSVGPIQNLFSQEGLAERKKWWDEIRQEVSNPATEEPDSATLKKILQRMEEEEFDQIWIWMAPNVRDVSGYYWLITQLKEFSGRIYLLSLNNLPFINEKGNVFYPVSLSEIPAREFVKAKRLARPVSLAEFETDPDEFLRLASENKNLRLLEGGKKIVQQSDDYYDKQILHFIQPAFQKIQRTVHQILLKSTEKLNESFLTWRMKQMVASGLVEQQGETIRLVVKAADEVDSVEVDG
ncbi:MAG TPA: DUF1835 domain-containing protein [Puia sp.]|nr:DUF1835 domain-containing protein [Puia sp.]